MPEGRVLERTILGMGGRGNARIVKEEELFLQTGKGFRLAHPSNRVTHTQLPSTAEGGRTQKEIAVAPAAVLTERSPSSARTSSPQ